jgi:hypothetical protein
LGLTPQVCSDYDDQYHGNEDNCCASDDNSYCDSNTFTGRDTEGFANEYAFCYTSIRPGGSYAAR